MKIAIISSAAEQVSVGMKEKIQEIMQKFQKSQILH
jgi:hypothetical protein